MSTQIDLTLQFFNKTKSKGHYAEMCLDLYRAITCYRWYDTLEEFMDINPELKNSRKDIAGLWKEFDQLTESEIAEIAIDLMTEF